LPAMHRRHRRPLPNQSRESSSLHPSRFQGGSRATLPGPGDPEPDHQALYRHRCPGPPAVAEPNRGEGCRRCYRRTHRPWSALPGQGRTGTGTDHQALYLHRCPGTLPPLLSRTGARVAGDATPGPVDHHQIQQAQAGEPADLHPSGHQGGSLGTLPGRGTSNRTTRPGAAIDARGSTPAAEPSTVASSTRPKAGILASRGTGADHQGRGRHRCPWEYPGC
jgi:hypothetical protein